MEGAKFEQSLFSPTIADKLSGWDGTTVSEAWGAAPTGGTARTTAIQNAGAWGDWLSQFPVHTPGLCNDALMWWAGGYASTSSLPDAGAPLIWAPHAGWYPTKSGCLRRRLTPPRRQYRCDRAASGPGETA